MRESEKARKDLIDDDEFPMEKTDPLAMWISGLLVIGFPCLLLILFIMGVTMLLFGLYA